MAKLVTIDVYPMPRTEALLSQLGDARHMSSLVLMKGYWQVLMCEQEKQKTAFAMLKGLFQFMVIPFSVHGMATMFQEMVDTV